MVNIPNIPAASLHHQSEGHSPPTNTIFLRGNYTLILITTKKLDQQSIQSSVQYIYSKLQNICPIGLYFGLRGEDTVGDLKQKFGRFASIQDSQKSRRLLVKFERVDRYSLI